MVHKAEVRERFIDGIAWIGLSQTPRLKSLQRRLYFQLTKEQMPGDAGGSEEENHEVSAFILYSIKVCN